MAIDDTHTAGSELPQEQQAQQPTPQADAERAQPQPQQKQAQGERIEVQAERKGEGKGEGKGEVLEPSVERGGRRVGRARGRGFSLADFWSESPFDLMRRMSADFDRLLSSFGFSDDELFAPRLGAGMWSPQIDVVDREGELVVRADLPGLKKEDLHVSVHDDALVIEGERRQEADVEEGGYRRSERAWGEFRRVVPLPAGAKADDAAASFDNGVLEIRVRHPKHEAHEIPIGADEKPEIH